MSQVAPPPATLAPSHAVAPPPAAPAKPRKKKRRRWIWISLALLLVVGFVMMRGRGNKEKPTAVTVEKAAKRDLTQLVSATGKVQPETEVKISPEVAGEIIELPVKVGQHVKKGDLLLRIKPDTYQAQVEQQEAAINSARAMNAQYRAQVLKAEQDLVRAENMFKMKVTSDADILAARTTLSVAKATYDSSLADIKRAESALSQTRDLLQKTTIVSPIDGVISVLNSLQGERVVATGQFAGTEVMRVADFSVMEIRLQVNENDIPQVKMNDSVAVSIDAFPGRQFRGRVTQIANAATTTGTGTQEEVTNFEVRVRVDAQGAALRPGMSGTADVESQTVRDVISVPLQAVTLRERGSKQSPEERDKAKAATQAQSDNSTELSNDKADAVQKKAERERSVRVVFVMKGGKAEQREVETGLNDPTYIEVKKGVQPGEEIITGPFRAVSRQLKEGTPVMLEKPAGEKK